MECLDLKMLRMLRAHQIGLMFNYRKHRLGMGLRKLIIPLKILKQYMWSQQTNKS